MAIRRPAVHTRLAARRSIVIRLAGILVLAWLLPQAAQAQRAANAADATVFIRTVGERLALVGDVR